jgi:rRNA-processing protein FCF1
MPDANPEKSPGTPAERPEGKPKDEPTQQTRPAQTPGGGAQPVKEGAPQNAKGSAAGGPNESADIFLKRKLFPDSAGIFSFQPKTLDEIKTGCCFVLDTNELLLPYKVGSHDLEEIRKVYRRLLGEKRLFVPAQVAKEFAANRPEHIKNLAHALVELKKAFRPTINRYPLLDGLEEYTALVEQWEKTQESLNACEKRTGELIERVQGWYWNDPVSKLYHELFVPEIVIEPEFKQEEILADHAWRIKHDIPPGYKDTRKPDKGVGDMLIWHTVLHVGKQEPCNSVVFVSGEKKADWVAKSDNQPLFPRYELVDEFRRATKGQSFHLISLPDLLDLFGADKSTVQRVRTEEALAERRGIAEADVRELVIRELVRIFPSAAIGLEINGWDMEVVTDEAPVSLVEIVMQYPVIDVVRLKQRAAQVKQAALKDKSRHYMLVVVTDEAHFPPLERVIDDDDFKGIDTLLLSFAVMRTQSGGFWFDTTGLQKRRIG